MLNISLRSRIMNDKEYRGSLGFGALGALRVMGVLGALGVIGVGVEW